MTPLIPSNAGPRIDYSLGLVTTGLGITSDHLVYYERLNNNLHFFGSFQVGTPTAVAASINIPNSLVALEDPILKRVVGSWHRNVSTASSGKEGNLVLDTTEGKLEFAFGEFDATTTPFASYTGSALFGAGNVRVYFRCLIPIAAWNG